MNSAFFAPRSRPLARRTFLRGSGAALALPFLDAMVPAFAPAADKAAATVPRRMVAIQTNMGIMPQFFFPEKAGKDFALTPYLEILKDFRKDMTVFSGLYHPNVDGGHQADKTFLTAAPHPGGEAFKNSISLDQVAAERIGALTRFGSFSLSAGCQETGTLSYTRSGVAIPAERSPAAMYKRMFVQGTAQEADARIEELRDGRSVLDFVNDDAKRLHRDLGPRDRARLDQYFSSVRDLEGQFLSSESWEKRPKPKTAAPAPQDIADGKRLIDRTRLMFDMTRLALETDSTRLVTLFIAPLGHVQLPGVTHETHNLTHHGNVPEQIAELRKIEEAQFQVLGELLGGLRGVKEGGETLLDRTMVLYGTCMGNASAHSNTNLPVLLAGGGFRHGQHLAFDSQKNYPLPNLFVSMLQRLGIAADKFASSTGTMRGLEMV